MSRFMAHPDPAARYLAHREPQPVDVWNERAQALAFVIGLGLILLIVVVLAPQ